MKSQKELYYANVKDLTDEEVDQLSHYELNCCDKCGEVDHSDWLYWLEYDESITEEEYKILSEGKYVALCHVCYTAGKKTFKINT